MSVDGGKVSYNFEFEISELFGHRSAWRCHTTSKASRKRTKHGRVNANLSGVGHSVAYTGECEEFCSYLNAFGDILKTASTTVKPKDVKLPTGLPCELLTKIADAVDPPTEAAPLASLDRWVSDSELHRMKDSTTKFHRRRHSMESDWKNIYLPQGPKVPNYHQNPRHIPAELYYHTETFQSHDRSDPHHHTGYRIHVEHSDAENEPYGRAMKPPMFGKPSPSALNYSIAELAQSREKIFDDSLSDFDRNLQAGQPIPASSCSSFNNDLLQNSDSSESVHGEVSQVPTENEPMADKRSAAAGYKCMDKEDQPTADLTMRPTNSQFVDIDIFLPPYYCDDTGSGSYGVRKVGSAGPGRGGSGGNIVCRFAIRVCAGINVRTFLSTFRSDLARLSTTMHGNSSVDVCLKCDWELYPVIQDSISTTPGHGYRASRQIKRPDQSKRPFSLHCKIEDLGISEAAILVLDTLAEDMSRDSQKSLGLDMARFIVNYRNMMQNNNGRNNNLEDIPEAEVDMS